MNNLIDFKQLIPLIKANFLELLREPAVLFWGILFPILMSLGLGIAFTKKNDSHMIIAVIEQKEIGYSSSKAEKKGNLFLKKSLNLDPELIFQIKEEGNKFIVKKIPPQGRALFFLKLIGQMPSDL